MPPHAKNREQKERLFVQTEKRRERGEEYFLRERREKSLNFFFRTEEQTAKEGGDSSGVFFGEETKDEFHRFLERDISWNIFIIFKHHFPSTRAKNNNTRVERKETRKTRRKK